MHFDLLLLNQGIAHQPRTGQGFMVHIHSSDLTVFISRIIINAFACIAARSIKRYFIFSISHIAAAALLLDRAENVEKLADALLFRTAGNGIHPSESGPDKTGLRG